jgi:hypothetical protein
MHFLLVLFIVCQFENQSGRTTDQAIHFLVLRDPRIPPQGREDRRHSQKYAPSTAVLWVFLVRLSVPTIYVNPSLYFGKMVTSFIILGGSYEGDGTYMVAEPTCWMASWLQGGHGWFIARRATFKESPFEDLPENLEFPGLNESTSESLTLVPRNMK